jgi:hypothetical protein
MTLVVAPGVFLVDHEPELEYASDTTAILIAFRKASVSPIEPRNPLTSAATVRPLSVAAMTKKIAENSKAIVRRNETRDSNASMVALLVVEWISLSRARHVPHRVSC